MAHRSVQPPHMGTTSTSQSDELAATTASSSDTSSSGFSMFDKASPTATSLSEFTPPITPIVSDDKPQSDATMAESTITAAQSTTTMAESDSMPLIDLRPDVSIDISSITPEIMQMAVVAKDYGSPQELGDIVNNIVNKKPDATMAGSDSMPLIDFAPDTSVDFGAITPEVMRLAIKAVECGCTLDLGTIVNNIVGKKKIEEVETGQDIPLVDKESKPPVQGPQIPEEPVHKEVLEPLDKPTAPPPAPRLSPVELEDSNKMTALSLPGTTVAKNDAPPPLVQPLNLEKDKEHPYQPINTAATPSSVLFKTGSGLTGKTPSKTLGSQVASLSKQDDPVTASKCDTGKTPSQAAAQQYIWHAPTVKPFKIDMSTLPDLGVIVPPPNPLLYGNRYQRKKHSLPKATFLKSLAATNSTRPDAVPIPASSQSPMATMAGQSKHQEVQSPVSQELLGTAPPVPVESASFPDLAALDSNWFPHPDSPVGLLCSDIEEYFERKLADLENEDARALVNAVIKEAQLLHALDPETTFPSLDLSFFPCASDPEEFEKLLGVLKAYCILSSPSTPEDYREFIYYKLLPHKAPEAKKAGAAGAHVPNRAIPRVEEDRNDSCQEVPPVKKSRIPVAVKTPTKAQTHLNEVKASPREPKSTAKGRSKPSRLPRRSGLVPSTSTDIAAMLDDSPLLVNESLSLLDEAPFPMEEFQTPVPAPSPLAPASAPSPPTPAPSAPARTASVLAPAIPAPAPIVSVLALAIPAPAPTISAPAPAIPTPAPAIPAGPVAGRCHLQRSRPYRYVPRKSTGRSSSGSSNSSKISANSDTPSVGGSSVSSNEEAVAPAGMGRAEWEQILAIIPRRSNAPNPNAPNVFNMSPSSLAHAAGSRIPCRATSSSAAPAGSPGLRQLPADKAEAVDTSSPTSTHSSDWSSQWLSPDAYDARKAAEAEAKAALVVQADSASEDEEEEGEKEEEESSCDSPHPSQYSDASSTWLSPEVQDSPHMRTQTWDLSENLPRSSNTPGWYGRGQDDDGDDGVFPLPSESSSRSVGSSSNIAGIGAGKGLPALLSGDTPIPPMLSDPSISSKTLPSINRSQRERELYTIEEELSTTSLPKAAPIISELGSTFTLIGTDQTSLSTDYETPSHPIPGKRLKAATSSIKSLFSKLRLPRSSSREKTAQSAKHTRDNSASSGSSSSGSSTLELQSHLEKDAKLDRNGVRRRSRRVLQGLKRLF